MKKLIWVIVFSLMVLPISVRALDVPQLQKYVNDNAGVLDSSCEAELNQMIGQIEQNTTDEIAILTINSLQGEILEQYSIRVFRENGIGKKDKNNGLLILAAMQDHKWRFETGYGLEGQLPDVMLSEIGNTYLTPNFRSGDYCTGFKETITQINNVLQGGKPDFGGPGTSPAVVFTQPGSILNVFGVLFPLFIWAFIIAFAIIGGRYRHSQYGHIYQKEKCPKCGAVMRKTGEEGDYIIYTCQADGTTKKVKKKKKDFMYFLFSGSGGHGGGGWGGGGGGGFGGGSGGGGGASGGW